MPQGAFETTHEIVREAAADAPSIFGIGVETLAATAAGAGTLGLVLGGLKLVRVLFTKNRPEKREATEPDAPFPRRLDEARQHRDIRGFVERRCPEFDTAVGRVVQDEMELSRQLGTKQDNETLKDFWERVRTRVDKLMPPSVREYLE